MDAPHHPYMPTTLTFSDYIPNTLSPALLILILTTILTTVLLITYRLLSLNSLQLQPRLIILWLILSSTLHLTFEGTYLLTFLLHLSNPSSYPPLTAQTHPYAQLWKEYALSDSRYLIPTITPQNTFLLTIECLTILILGPLCIYTAYLTSRGKPAALPLQIVVATAHLYGCLLYYATAVVEGVGSRDGMGSEEEGYCVGGTSGYYFWVYFVAGNGPWVVVSLWVIWSAGRQIVSLSEMVAVARVEALEREARGGKKKEL